MMAPTKAYVGVLGAAEAHPGTSLLKSVSVGGGSPFHLILCLSPDIYILWVFFLITEV